MAGERIVITGGSGFVGGLVARGLAAEGYRIDNFDRLRGPLVSLLRWRFFGTDPERKDLALRLWQRQKSAEAWLLAKGVLRPTADDILGARAHMVERFRGAYAVIHMAALPHPDVPGATDADFERINFQGSVNVHEAAEAAGVEKFVFTSSAQVYGINKPVKIDQFPILETNYLPTREDGLHAYGYLKRKFEEWMAERSRSSAMRSVGLRLEFPGMKSGWRGNFYISTSVENLVRGYSAALKAGSEVSGEAFNIADAEIDKSVVDIQKFIAKRWPDVPNHSKGNQCLLSIDKARRLLGYDPKTGGRYYDLRLVI
jgi:nucleoside-diphosphate-sugar epimerase